ncbi:hypothetical protein RRG08_065130 [Elysia crispata]|uniref:Calponin-homology (CH) domain-containing protein n=1 Tax=Elysia crispata TaxID=231223 RepID=A0AAE1DC83_9GAST|nr:hypothetical protein RRG08_065130 [Elysia crispata]
MYRPSPLSVPQAVTKQSFKYQDDTRKSLENGVLLCELLNSLRPGTIRRINKLPTPLAGLDNINVFLKACKSTFCLTDTHLFNPSDLEDLSQRAIAEELRSSSSIPQCLCVRTYSKVRATRAEEFRMCNHSLPGMYRVTQLCVRTNWTGFIINAPVEVTEVRFIISPWNAKPAIPAEGEGPAMIPGRYKLLKLFIGKHLKPGHIPRANIGLPLAGAYRISEGHQDHQRPGSATPRHVLLLLASMLLCSIRR